MLIAPREFDDMRSPLRLIFLALVMLATSTTLRAADVAAQSATIGLDHLPTAVADLEQASADYRQLGFSLKAGRLHENGLRNNHIKFEDGAGIELISPSTAPGDALSRHYTKFLQHGDGPAYVAFHVRSRETMLQVLKAAGIRYDADKDELAEPLLDFLFLVQDNRSPTDRPQDFVHANSSFAMTGVWLALNEARRVRFGTLLLAFGATRSRERVLAPAAVVAEVWSLGTGRVLVLPQGHQLQRGRPIVGAEFSVKNIANAPCEPRSDRSRCQVPPRRAHGLWLTFRQTDL